MTNEQAKKMLKAKLECLKRETSGTDFDCNNSNCDECSLCYEQGNMGEQKEALDKALEQEPETAHWIKVPDEETFFCSKCNARLYDEQIYLPFNYCPNCGAKMIEQQGSEET